MKLPSYVLECLNALEAAGYPAYAVGGCVRDACLGLQPHDYDICTAAVPQQTEAVFAGKKLVLAGEKHGTVGVVLSEDKPVEITTFRTEGAYRDNRHPDWVKFVDSVESDLARRDYTVNAMAYSPTRGFADPFGGRVDLESKMLRAVGDPVTRFQEDSLRILRGVRFAVKYGLTVDPATEDAMESQAQLMDNLAEERVFYELCKLLPLVSAEDLCRFAPILGTVIPELQPMIGFDQHSPHHAYDLFTHTAHVTAGVSADLTLRWAALLHDVGKPPCFSLGPDGVGHFYGHAAKSTELAEGILTRLRFDTAGRTRIMQLIRYHDLPIAPEAKPIRRLMNKLGVETVRQLFELHIADTCGQSAICAGRVETYRQAERVLDELLAADACFSLKDLAVNGDDLLALGLRGRAVGAALQACLDAVMDETLPNDRAALLGYAAENLQRFANS
mgnify:CR=1 FL=1